MAKDPSFFSQINHSLDLEDIRNKFGFLPGMEVNVIAAGNRALIVKNTSENRFMNWLGRGKRRSKKDIDQTVDDIRGRFDE